MQKLVSEHRTVADVMTATVHVASPSTPLRALANLIQDNRVSAVPIVDQSGVPVGVVSASDLLFKERRPEVESAADVMTSPAITVGLETPIAEAARVMHEHDVRRLVVVEARGRIAGILTRSDLLQVFLRNG